MLYDDDLLGRLEKGLRSALPRWALEPTAPLSLLVISENATYLLDDAARGCKLIFRVHRPGYHSEAEILSELSWIEALRGESVVETPRPVPSGDGRLLVDFFDGETTRHAVAFEYMSGKEPEGSDDLVKWFGHLGEISARLHRHSKGWARPAGFVRKHWTFDTIIGAKSHWGDWRHALGLRPEGLAILERLHERLGRETEAYGYGPDRFGLVHCDMRTANLLVDGPRLGVIDFDDCGMSWFGYDFATAVSFIEHEPIIPELMDAWLAGYKRTADFSGEDARRLPMLVMLRRMQLTAWIASHSETPTAQGLGAAYTDGTVALAESYLSKPELAA
jgi:Ser/Thr protein kinase RdoA (MazF antagonist)